MQWFNVLATDPKVKSAKANLVGKFTKASTKTTNVDCTEITSFKSERITMDKQFQQIFSKHCPSAPERYSLYRVALLKASQLVPTFDPPALPAEHRQVKNRRKAGALVEKKATWVGSHRCHNHNCVNVDHLCWEPSWFNRLRDNCLGGEKCFHRPKPCLNAHRPAEGDLLDWTAFIQERGDDC